MKIAVIGPGAVGTVIAYELKKTMDVTLLGRSEKTMTVEMNNRKNHVNVTNLMFCKTTFDLIFICVKTTKLEEILPHIKRLIHEDTILILCENGMGQTESINLPNCYQAVVYISGQKKGSTVRHYQDKILIVPSNEQTNQVCRLLHDTAIDFKCDPDYDEKLWFKLLVNLGINTLTALSKNTAQIFKLKDMRELAAGLLDEGVTVAQAYDQPFDNETIDEIMAIYDSYPAEMGSSMYYDVLNLDPTEYEYIQGAVKRFAAAKKIDTPLLDVCLTLLKGYQMDKK